ncbi:MAG: response regulator transcription factor [Granulosicoccus sp.]
MKTQKTLLLIEDEEAIRVGLIDVFVYHGYAIEACDNGPDGLSKALNGQYDLILLDVMLPGMNGFDVCEAIRQQDRDQAIIMLTAKSSDEEIIQGLKLGADDYVSKPFSIAQLVLRVEAVLRRSLSSVQDEAELHLQNGTVIDIQNLCGEREGEALSFTRREMDMLTYLASHTTRPVPREELLTRVWGYAKDLNIETRTVDIHIAKLRRKIESAARSPETLVTVRGAGYRLLLADGS